jgi:epoxyqueuosine reductase
LSYGRREQDEHRDESVDYLKSAVQGPQDGRCGARPLHKDGTPAPPSQRQAGTGRIAQYARGSDYHGVMRAMLEGVARRLAEEVAQPFHYRAFVDTGPLLERSLAAAAGLGWVGKNTLLLNERVGSFLFLGELITTLEMTPNNPAPDHCGNCTRCLDACPTDAFPEPYRIDASRCISYFTIEHRGGVPREFLDGIGDWAFGCDICQDVCPFNTRAPAGTQPDIMEERVPAAIDLVHLLELTSGDYRRLTRGAATLRAKRSMWRRNAAIALGNQVELDGRQRAALERAAHDDDDLVRRAAAAALETGDSRGSTP